jgi:site-specific recombinase XerD
MKQKLLDKVRSEIRVRHYSKRTEDAYVYWIRRYILFHNKEHPLNLKEKHLQEFLTHLAVQERVSVSTQNQALNAILFLYKTVLSTPLGMLTEVTRAHRTQRIPTVFSPNEVKKFLST